MAQAEEPTPNKRKATPEPRTDDVAGKRMKLGDGDGNEPPNDGLQPDVKGSHIDPTPVEKEQREASAGRSSTTTQEHRAESEQETGRTPKARRPSAGGGPSGRRNISLEEKKRGQRLFGGLVSALNRSSSGTQHQKRLEIERRQHEKANQRRAEDEKRRIEKLEQLQRTRQIEQVKLDEQVMRTRHSSMLAKARSLQTKSKPKLYYLPWEATKEQEDIISDQVRAAEELIDRERRNFRESKEQRLKALGVSPPPRSPSPPPRQQPKQQPEPAPETIHEPQLETVPNSGAEEATVGEPKPAPRDTNPDAVAPTPSRARSPHHDKDHDENGDEMVQDEEDIVIY
ncbi:hypothetical protein N658DRAFT_512331 [Parathielavia hyrcaniae]|uniref:Pinin/SDK/MemA protein domain-containing protein n=1 Tax=Parathielavia hyrcaniae TaxID=113614 RepID=A0AAN6T739_9PEZI|nr:hypothetical protein N658DRAFT_512331 [Parathielavia hyrcaniae]